MLSLSGSNVLITGAAGAIGSEIARLFQSLGASLFLTDREPAPLAALAEALRAAGGKVGFLHGDVTDRRSRLYVRRFRASLGMSMRW